MKSGGGEGVGNFRNLKRGRATPIPWGVLLGGLLFVNLFILLPAFVVGWLSTETGWPTAYGSDCTRRGCVLVNLYHSPKLLDGGSAHELGLFALLWAWTGAHCRPIPDCQRSGESHLLYHSALLAAAAIGFGVLVRTIARAVARALAERPGVALAVNIAAIWVLVPIGFHVVLLGLVSIPWPG